MRNIKIVADSSADMLTLGKMPFAAAPLKVITDQREFVDDAALDVEEMVTWFDSYKGRSKTSCPNPSDWLEAFGDAEEVFCVTITSGLSGSYNSACAAAQMWCAEDGSRKAHVIDSLSAGPELVLLLEKLEEYIGQDLSFEEIREKIEAYKKHTGLVFILESLKNFAANGRISPAIAKITGVLGIRIVGKASDQGTLEPVHKSRGAAKALEALLEDMKAAGLSRGKVRIAHCRNESAAAALAEKLRQQLNAADVTIHKLRGLCSFYAEKGGLLVGFEKF